MIAGGRPGEVVDLRGWKKGGREGGREGWVRKGHILFLGEVGRYGCRNDGLDETDTMVREGGREGNEGGMEGGREGGRTYRVFVGHTLAAFGGGEATDVEEADLYEGGREGRREGGEIKKERKRKEGREGGREEGRGIPDRGHLIQRGFGRQETRSS